MVVSFLAGLAATVGIAQAQTASEQSASCCTLPALSELIIQIDADLSAKTSRSGDMFPLKLAAAIYVDGKMLVPAGAEGEGEVIQASKPGLAGKAGELSIAARYISYGGNRIALRSLHFEQQTGTSRIGQSGSITAVAAGAGVFAPVAGPAGIVLSLMIVGGDIKIPKGTKAFVKTATSVVLPEVTQAQPNQN